jgi:hypothetical protein
MSGSSLKSFAPSFYQDLNGDGVIGRAINGGVTLEADLARRTAHPPGIIGSDPGRSRKGSRTISPRFVRSIKASSSMQVGFTVG